MRRPPPLLVDGAGRAGVAIHHFADGRELMLLSFDQAPGALHSQQLMAGVASWLGRGVFIGEKRAYFGPQLDDVFLGTVMEDGTTFRMSGDDLRNAARWQQQARATAVGAGVTLTLPFNGAEVTDTDGLTAAAREVGPQFAWLSHTFDHHRLDAADYARMTMELTSDDAVMTKYAFGPYDRASPITPDVSGLANASVTQAAVDFGIRQVVCDASTAACQPPPNSGLANAVVPGMFMVPRLATSLYANVSTPTEWVSSYNWLNPATSGAGPSYDQILSGQSALLLPHLLEGDIDPWMFHQSNLRAYDGTHTLFTDPADPAAGPVPGAAGASDYQPVDDRHRRAHARPGSAAVDGAGGDHRAGTDDYTAAASAVRVPVTGARASNAEAYGQTIISMVEVPAGGKVSLPLVTTAGADAGTPPSSTPATPGDAAVTGAATVTMTSSSGGGCGCVAGGDLPWSRPTGGWGAALTALLWTARTVRPRRRRALT